MLRILVIAVLAAFALDAAAQWVVGSETVKEGEEPIKVAMVRNASGHALLLYQDEASMVRGLFIIRPGFDAIAESSCPTYQIDDHKPLSLILGTDSCVLEPTRAHFIVGPVADGRVRSDQLLGIMNGTTLLFRYPLASRGYRETVFTLQGSKQAVYEVIGADVKVVPLQE
jgi:hypothetical protein